jgi:hypothetical protein
MELATMAIVSNSEKIMRFIVFLVFFMVVVNRYLPIRRTTPSKSYRKPQENRQKLMMTLAP